MGIFGKILGKKGGRRVVVIGLDGTPHTLLTDLIGRGLLPNLAELSRDGTLLQMDTSIPEISSVGWTTFSTGVNPGAHGIYGFMELAPNSYKMIFPNSNYVKSPTLWAELTAAGKKSIVINVPSTYPAQELNGFLVAGFVAITLEKATYPRSMVPKLQQMGYRIDVDTMKSREDHDFLIRDLTETHAARRRLILEEMGEPWDFFMGVVTGTDRIQHYLWDAFENPSHKHHQAFLDYYKSVDSLVGDVRAKLPKDATLMLLSDHGFTGIKQELYLNRWLTEQGYLKFMKEKPQGFEDMSPESRAFALDPSRIYIHAKGRYPNGSVEPGDVLRLVDEIAGKALEIKGPDGETVIRKVFKRDQIYSGPQVGLAPDLVLLSNWGFDLKGSLGRPAVFGRTNLSGMHTQDDAFFLIDHKFEFQSKINIADLKGVIQSEMNG